LSVTAQKSGHTVGGTPSDAVVITETYTGTTGAQLGLTETQTASNAQFSVDGLAVERTTNQVTDVLQGVTLDLKAESTDPIEIAVAPDPEKVMEKLEAFTEAYNATVDALKSAQEESGALARGALSELSTLVSSAVTGAASDFVNLSSIGLETQWGNGKLELDKSKLEEVLAQDPSALAKLFTTTDTGLSATMGSALERYTDGYEGIIKTTQDGLRDRVDRFENQIEDRERAVQAYEDRMVRQFTRLETLMNEMNAESARFASAMPMGMMG
jgi:flagellar hook-associated protein 2